MCYVNTSKENLYEQKKTVPCYELTLSLGCIVGNTRIRYTD